MTAHLRAHKAADEGFTLIELLVVISILGVLAAVVVVVAVRGVGHKGVVASAKTEATILQTAEEAYCAKNGTYGTVAQLQQAPGFLADAPKDTSVVVTSSGPCGGTGFTIGSSTFTSTTGPVILGASNNTNSFTFLAPSFIDAHSSVQLVFNASSALVTRANTPGDADVLFASADEANVDKVIATTDTVAGGSPGTCTVSSSTTCAGIGSTKVQYTNGRLVAFTCRANTPTLPSASNGSTTCAAPANGYDATPPTTVAQVVAQLNANPKLVLTIANPGTLPPSTTSPPTAPYGLAAYQALTSSGADGGGLTPAQYNTLVSNKQIVYGSNVTATQTNVESGAADIALIPKSFVVSPAGDDANAWTTVSSALHDPIRQWAVVLDHGSEADRTLAQNFLNYVLSSTGQSVLSAFGYDPVS